MSFALYIINNLEHVEPRAPGRIRRPKREHSRREGSSVTVPTSDAKRALTKPAPDQPRTTILHEFPSALSAWAV
jgi:hypothetical protein